MNDPANFYARLASACHAEEMRERRRSEDFNHNVITSLNQLAGWTIIGIERHKPGVVKYFATRKKWNGAEQIIGYAKDDVFSAVQLPNDTGI